MLLFALPFIVHAIVGALLTSSILCRAKDGVLKSIGALLIVAAFCHSCYVIYLACDHVVFDYKLHMAMILYSLFMMMMVFFEYRGIQLYLKSLGYVILSGAGLAWSILYVLTSDSIYADPILVKTMVQVSVQALCMFAVSFIVFITNHRYYKKFGAGAN